MSLRRRARPWAAWLLAAVVAAAAEASPPPAAAASRPDGAVASSPAAPAPTSAAAGPAAGCPPEPDTAAAAAAAPRDRGFLWRLTRDGRTSWLYGTLHVGRPEWAAPGPRLRDALREADAVALELDPLDPAVARDFERALQALPGAQAAPDPDHRARLTRLAERACVALEAGAHPLMQVMQLTLAEARRARLDPRYAQEIVLSMAARALRRPVRSLETAAQQLAALLPPDAAQVPAELDRSLGELEQGRVRAVLQRLADVWEHGDLAGLQDYPRWCDCLHDEADRAAFVRLNDARNPGLAERIAALHADERLRVFAAVGALHMTGPQALPRLLAERHGFVVERVVLTR